MKIHFLSSGSDKANCAYDYFTKVYGQVDSDEADVIVTLSGDGTIIKAIHENIDNNIPIYGMNCGKVGFLANELNATDNLAERIKKAYEFKIYPLEAEAKTYTENIDLIAINEIYLFRDSYQTSVFEISIDDKLRSDEIIGDGILTTSSIGSTAYSMSLGGPIIPLSANLLSIVGMGIFSPKAWHGALIDGNSSISIKVKSPTKRPVIAVADYKEIKNIVSIKIRKSTKRYATLLFDDKDTLKEKILTEQFK